MQIPTGPLCPHCNELNPAGASFCGSCGKAMPVLGASGPTVLSGDALAGSGAGQQLQSQELAKKTRSAAGALLAVAIIQTLVGLLMFFVVKAQVANDPTLEIDPVFFIVLGGVAAIFWGLWFWARKNPLPAAIVGLVLFLTLWFVDILVDPTQIARGIIVKIIVIAVLVKAIKAGAQHRKLMQQGAGTAY